MKKKVVLVIICLIVVFLVGLLFIIHKKSNIIILKKEEFTYELGEKISADVSNYIKDADSIKNITEYKIVTDDFKIVDKKLVINNDKPTVGDYNINIVHKNVSKKVIIKIVDTTSPEFTTFEENIKIEQTSEEVDLIKYFEATDLTEVKITIDGEYDLTQEGDYDINVIATEMTGLNPVETAMLGWDMYYKDIDKTITTFMNSEKGDEEYTPLQEAIEYKNKHMITKSIMEEINEKGKDSGYILFPFGKNPYVDIEDLYNKIETLCNEEGKKYIYAYDTEPDHTMHELGTDAHEINEIVENINFKVEELSRKLKDTVIFVVADHGHKNVENIMLKDYPDIVDCLEKNTSIEPRAINFFIRENKKQKFEVLFNEYFSNDFDLYTKEDVINSNLFGKGKENEIFRDILGDYLAIAKTNKTLLYGGSKILKSQHAGYTDDEIYVPLIVINTNNI